MVVFLCPKRPFCSRDCDCKSPDVGGDLNGLGGEKHCQLSINIPTEGIQCCQNDLLGSIVYNRRCIDVNP